MVGDELQLSLGHSDLIGTHGLGEFVGLGLERLEVGLVLRGVVRTALGELLAHDVGVSDGVAGVGPQVGIGLAVFLGEGEVVDVVGLGKDDRAELDDLCTVLLVGLGKLQRRILELEAIDEDEIGLVEQLGCLRLGLEGVRVGALGDDPLDRDGVARHSSNDRRER